MGEKTNFPGNYSFEEEIHGNENLNNLILYNDDVHSFDYVIDSLVQICDHDAIQAEQCAYITHYKGKCDVKRGEKSLLSPMRHRLIEKGLIATID